MGYKDSGCGVKTSGWCKRSGRSTTSEVYVGKGGRIWWGEVRQRIEETVKVDNEFRVGFVLFTLGTLLCPPLAEEMDGVRSWKETGEPYVARLWGEKTSKKVIMWVKSKGGFESNKICVRRRDIIRRKDCELCKGKSVY
ncbi:hypothetical protein Pyn_21064 [Prunus yedoensis var. nudiflora]|uniref:Uncharacterized protein n=1 Tax=Prunus yedoensis var. nudiflora TaxID=2094558 RepID=A0A314ZSG6_PRUYE|nr:hypothetical protein Pyn_21064 [Prunus yedoensis var. nudiflora]